LKNKHIVTASIVTPVLALISYFLIDYMLSEPPGVAEEGQSYPLVEKPNCRYDSGRCGLKNGEFELELVVEVMANNKPVLRLNSVHPLAGVMVALVAAGQAANPPVEMYPTDEQQQSWSVELEPFNRETDRLQVAASAQKSLYFGDVALKFAVQNK
jgi:hypothetical protein